MTTTKDLKKLLRDSNYEVKVETVPSGVIASFPLEFHVFPTINKQSQYPSTAENADVFLG